MFDPAEHPLFEPVDCPNSGVRSFRLQNPFGKPQVTPYFAIKAFTADERYLFGYIRHGPVREEEIDAAGMTVETIAPASLFVADLLAGSFVVSRNNVNYPSACFDENRRLIFFAKENSIFSFEIETARERCWFTLPHELTSQGPRAIFCTHLSVSADGRRLLLDGRYGRHCFLAYLDLEEMRFEVVFQGKNVFYDHANYSPSDPHLAVLASDWWLDPDTGAYNEIPHRIWTIRTDDGKPPRPIMAPPGWNGPHPRYPTHEWWSDDGKGIFTILHEEGIAFINVETFESSIVWKGSACHGQSCASGRWFVVDQKTYLAEPRSVVLVDSKTHEVLPIAINMPRPPDVFNRLYHLDPHPQISPSERFVIYSGTQLGLSDVYLFPIPKK
jgi:hypothetical protein